MLSRKAGKDTGNRINVMCINYRDKSKYRMYFCWSYNHELDSDAQWRETLEWNVAQRAS